MKKPRCFVTEIDGMPVRVHGNPNMPKKSREALEEIVRAAVKQVTSKSQVRKGTRR